MSFPSFNNQFSTSPISTAYPDYLGLNVTSSVNNSPPPYTSPVQLYWAFAEPWQTTPFANNMQILTNDSTSNIIKLPDATMASTSQTAIVFNTSTNSIILQNFSGTSLGTIETTIFYYLTLTDNSTQAGTWQLAPFATGTVPPPVISLIDSQLNTVSTAVIPPYEGLPMFGGLQVVLDEEVTTPADYLKVNMLVQNYDTTMSGAIYNQTLGDRGTLLVVSANSGNLTYNLISAASAGNGFIFSVNNASTVIGSGILTIISNGSDTIEGLTTPFVLNPANSCSFISDGVSNWTSLGFGLNTIPTNFNNVTIRLAAGSQAFPPLGFFNDTSQSAGLFYNLGTTSSQIVQSFPIGSYPDPGTPQVIANFTANSTYPNGQAILTENSIFTPSVVSINPTTSLSLNTPIINLAASAILNASTSFTLNTPLINLQSTSIIDLGVSGTTNGLLTLNAFASSSVAGSVIINANQASPSIQGNIQLNADILEQQGISIYTLMLAYA